MKNRYILSNMSNINKQPTSGRSMSRLWRDRGLTLLDTYVSLPQVHGDWYIYKTPGVEANHSLFTQNNSYSLHITIFLHYFSFPQFRVIQRGLNDVHTQWVAFQENCSEQQFYIKHAFFCFPKPVVTYFLTSYIFFPTNFLFFIFFPPLSTAN